MINTQNQPAFPQDCRHKDGSGYQFFGMTLRDYFAAKAMQADISSSGCDWDAEAADLTARTAYMTADAMLKAREQ